MISQTQACGADVSYGAVGWMWEREKNPVHLRLLWPFNPSLLLQLLLLEVWGMGPLWAPFHF